MNMFNYSIVLEGKDGLFRAEKDITLFYEHATENELKDALKAVKSEIKKMLKAGEVVVTGTRIEERTYDRKSTVRFVIKNYDLVAEHRPFTGYDFSDINEYMFTSDNERIKWFAAELEKDIRVYMTDIPEEISRYVQKLRQET